MKTPEINVSNAGDNNGAVVGMNNGTIENHYHNGMTPQEAVQQSLVLFQSNFPQLERIAADIARTRVDEIAKDLFSQIAQKCPDKFERFSDPDIQCNLIEIEKSYARSGKTYLKNALSALLIHRVQSDNDLVNICCNEAIKIAPSLTVAQLNMLSLKFLAGHTQNRNITNIASLKHYIESYLLPFIQDTKPTEKDAAHLTSFRCWNPMTFGTNAFGIVLATNYHSVFNMLSNSNRVNIKGLPISPDEYKDFKISENGVEVSIDNYIKSKIPSSISVFDYYDGLLSIFDLTSLGKLIGAINAENKLGIKCDLSIWI